MLLRIAIVDDLPQDAERLQQALTAEGQTNIIRYESGDALLSAISPEQLDALFLDICMEGTNGIDTARKLREQAPTLPIVFVTSSKEYVWQSFPVHPFDYLLKPFEQARIRQLLDDLLRILQHPEPEIEVRFARKLMRLPYSKVYYALAQNHFVRIMSDEGECRATGIFAQVEKELCADPRFLVCNRGIIINMSAVLRFENDCIQMLDGTQFPVRQKDKGRLFATFTQYQFRHMRDEIRAGGEETTIEISQYIRYFLEFLPMLPAAVMVLMSVWEQLLSPKRTACQAMLFILLACASGAAVCCWQGWVTNTLLLPFMALAFVLFRRALKPNVSVSQSILLFLSPATVAAVALMLSVCLNARREVTNVQPIYLLSTVLLNLGIESLLAIVYALVAVPWLRWLLREYQVERVWRVVSPIPAICIAFIIFIMPQDPATVLVNRMQRVSIVALLMAMMAMLLLLYQFYRMAQESVRNLTLIQENQMLELESRRYAQLREYMAQTRRLRHDFRQHLHVIAGLTESGKMEELRAYLKEYESEFVDAHATFCANGAMDAIAGYYAATAAQKNIPLAWQLNLPEKLPMREADLCMVLGNLLETALRASERLPEAMRRVSVICHMLSPAMMGLIVENRYDGQLSRREGKLLSTSHPGFGTGLLSVETVAKKYHGQMTVETENGVFRVNVLLNL